MSRSPLVLPETLRLVLGALPPCCVRVAAEVCCAWHTQGARLLAEYRGLMPPRYPFQYHGKHEEPWPPPGAGPEHRALDCESCVWHGAEAERRLAQRLCSCRELAPPFCGLKPGFLLAPVPAYLAARWCAYKHPQGRGFLRCIALDEPLTSYALDRHHRSADRTMDVGIHARLVRAPSPSLTRMRQLFATAPATARARAPMSAPG